MKKLLAAALISGMAVSAQAGSITYVAPDSVMIDVEPNMGIGGSWIIPAIIASILIIAVTSSSGETEGQ